MGLFVDQMLLRLRNPAELIQVLAPAADTNRTRLRTLLGAMYDFPFATLHDVRDVVVRRSEFERPLFPSRQTRGSWTQSAPSYSRTDLAYDRLDTRQPTWLDLAAEVGLTLVLEIDAGEVESIVVRELANFTSLADFRARFQFIDLDAFMARHGITTVDELRERFRYLLAEIRLRPPGPFDPNNPANQHRYTLNLAVLIREVVDVAAALREAKLARTVLERSLAFREETAEAELRTPYAPMLVFPEAALSGLPFNAADLQAFFAAEGVLAVFIPPP